MLTYKVRDTDIISSQYDLERSIMNNLFYFFQALPPKYNYEIHLVSSVQLQDGTIQRGASHQVQTGKYANGAPKYKTIVNKFAVLDIYITLDYSSRKKLQRILLAPIDIISYNPTTEALKTESADIPKIISTGISTPQPVLVPAMEKPPVQSTTPPPATTPEIPATLTITGQTGASAKTLLEWYTARGRTMPTVAERAIFYEGDGLGTKESYTGTSSQDAKYLAELKRRAAPMAPFDIPNPAFVPVSTPAVTNNATLSVPTEESATTLFEWYQAQGQTLPSIAERSLVYEGLGLGPAGTYIGSSEQNVKMLNKLKGK